MRNKPVAFQCRHKRLDSVADIWREGSIRHCQKGKRGRKGSDRPVEITFFNYKIYHNYNKREKDQGFVQIGKGGMPDSYFI